MIRKRQLFLANVRIQLLVILTLEWESTAKEGIQKDTQCPDVDWRSSVFNFTNDFRCHIRWSTAENFDFLLMWDTSRKTKINEFDSRPGFIEQNVLKFDVSVGHISLMQIMNSKYDLLPQELSFDLSHLSIWFTFEIAVQGSTIDVFHNQKYLFVRLKGLVKFGKTLVVDFLHDLDFSLHTFSTIGFQQLELLVNLDSDLLVEDFM